MGADHTPGPWTADGLNVRTGTGATLATVTRPLAPWEVGQPEADARLIAAAPDLLAALQDTVQVFEGLDRAAELHETLYPVLANLRTAIAKAKGEA